MRELLLGTWTLAPAGYELEPTIQDKLTKAMLDDFRMLNPCVAELKASMVESRIAAQHSGLVLSAWLKELPQMELDLRLKSGRSVTDLYSMDVERTLQSIQSSREHVAMAVSPHITSSEIRDLSSSYPLLVRLRRRSKAKQSRTPVIADIGLRAAATSFSLGLVRTIEATVAALTPGHCRLQNVQITTPMEDDSSLIFPKTTEMARPAMQKNGDAVMELLSTMESGLTVSMDVMVLLDWASGQPHKLELRKIHPRQQ